MNSARAKPHFSCFPLKSLHVKLTPGWNDSTTEPAQSSDTAYDYGNGRMIQHISMGCCYSSKIQDSNSEKGVEVNQKPVETASAAVRRPSVRPVEPEVDQSVEDTEYSIIRLLLLGAAESGKTTLLEQIRILYNQKFTDSELYHRKAFIYSNILNVMKILVRRMKELELPFETKDAQYSCEIILNEDSDHFGRFTEELASAIERTWRDGALQKLYAKRSEINLNDSTKYFLNNLKTINSLDYNPTPKDLIMSYIPTVGVQNVIFNANNKSFQLFDIGGQRIDRRKWATMYDGIDAIFFCLAISEYNQTMIEDGKTNRLKDSLELLSKISAEPKFKLTQIFLFLNEVDVFREKLQVIPLQNYLPEYKGSSTEDALDFMESLARQAVSGRPDGLLHVYRITCIDTEAMGKTLASVFKTLRRK